MLKINQIKTDASLPLKDQETLIKNEIASLLGTAEKDISNIQILKRSLDARKKPELFYVFSLWADCVNEEKILKRNSRNANISSYRKKEYVLPHCGNEELTDRPVVVGMGPAGLFCDRR